MKKIEIEKMRKEYLRSALSESSVDSDPVIQFEKWFEDAFQTQVEEPSAMFLATASKEGIPSGRIVLLKGFSQQGFLFYTNYTSRKGREIKENPAVALTFHWKELERQVRITGKAKRISARESEEYFRSRPFESRISAVISPQSQVIPSREFLELERTKVIQVLKGTEPARPVQWGGYIVKPDSLEFWQGRESRLHDRILYTWLRNKWKIVRLAP